MPFRSTLALFTEPWMKETKVITSKTQRKDVKSSVNDMWQLRLNDKSMDEIYGCPESEQSPNY